MATYDFSAVKIQFDKASYNTGEQMVLSLTGKCHRIEDPTVTHEEYSVDVRVETVDGNGTTYITVGPVDIVTTTPGAITDVDVKMAYAGSGAIGTRLWSMPADGLSALGEA